MKPPKTRVYRVWVKGRRHETECWLAATHKANALIALSLIYGIKSYRCDGLLTRKEKSNV